LYHVASDNEKRFLVIPGQKELFNDLYNELRSIAGRYVGRERRGHTLQPTALVHEAYLKLAGNSQVYSDRRHFLCVAASAMRQILMDHARARNSAKRGGGESTIHMDALDLAAPEGIDVLVVHEAIAQLERWDERQARVVELRFFTGLSIEETASVLDMSPKTVKRDWAMARAWIQQQWKGQSQ
jgi:RNA polymerase sigma-70 factor, ECF subfamily